MRRRKRPTRCDRWVERNEPWLFLFQFAVGAVLLGAIWQEVGLGWWLLPATPVIACPLILVVMAFKQRRRSGSLARGS